MTHHTIVERYLPGRTGTIKNNVICVRVKHDELIGAIRTLTEHKLPFITMAASDERAAHHVFRIHYVFGVPGEKTQTFIVLVLDVHDEKFPTLARDFAWAHMYEREIHTLFGLTPVGHPDLRSTALFEENWPSRTYPLRKDFKWDTKVPETKSGEYPWNVVEGEGVYEIPVGPIHAGIIEPGNFRFSMAGEEIVSLEPRLGWVHKGVEKLFENLAAEKHVTLAEHVSGDSSFSHALAYSQATETLTDTIVPHRALYLRSIFAEIERLTMHIFDVGNIVGNGTGFSVMAAQGFRMVEELRQLQEKLTGSRFMRGVAIPGGVTTDISLDEAIYITAYLARLHQDFNEMVHIFSHSSIFLNRVQTAGALPKKVAEDLGAFGVGARACGIERDVRIDYPYAAYATHKPTIALEEGGDVEARIEVRVKEVAASIMLLTELLHALPKGGIHAKPHALPQDGIAVSLVEGWRGEIAYVVMIEKGSISRVKVRDASFINWQLFPHLATKDIVPDFPLINKSFNNSYTGNDL